MLTTPTFHAARPRIAITLGDVAGIGPEVIVKAIASGDVFTWAEPLVIGHPDVLRRAVQLVGATIEVVSVESLETNKELTRHSGNRTPSAVLSTEYSALSTRHSMLPCWNPTDDAAAHVPPARNDARAGRAAFECLVAAIQAAKAGHVDAICTAPLSKAALHLAGLKYPGHTEILAEQCGVREYAMMLYLPPGEMLRGSNGLGVVHVTLHTSIRSVPGLLSTAAVLEKIRLVKDFMQRITGRSPRVGVCALNPHAGEEGLFGDEESRLIEPAVSLAITEGIAASGPFPADTLLKRACDGEFDAVVAMYHDQGHIALKLIGFHRAVNVTLGLPIIRTSPSQGTAFDIAWQGVAKADGMLEALRVAARLCSKNGDSL
ncbi:MAG: 4-hydroxythreonine-4-phosphate dehydrogenase PdxA [Planctomycetales bacterium]|nr:4-hydroxythreonine-4-phosphate dehydrogenase PdxA [Planctomycetales bacterium]